MLFDVQPEPAESTGMTADEICMVEALSRCRFQPATAAKRLVRDWAARDKSKPMTEKGRAALWAIVWSWRRQLPKDLVEMAGRYSGQKGWCAR